MKLGIWNSVELHCVLLHGLSCFLPSPLEHPFNCCSRKKKQSKTEPVFPSSGNRPNVHVNQTDMQSQVLEVFMVRWLLMCCPHCQDAPACRAVPGTPSAPRELFAENFGCVSLGWAPISTGSYELSSPGDTSGFSLVTWAAWWTSASLNLIKDLPSASAEAHCNPRLGRPPEGSLFAFPESLHCSLRNKGLANWSTANRPLKDPVLALAEQSSADCLKQCCEAVKWVTEGSEVDSSF